THFAVAKVVCQYEDNVRLLRRKREPGAKEGRPAQQHRSKRDEHSPAELERTMQRTEHDSTVNRNRSVVQIARRDSFCYDWKVKLCCHIGPCLQRELLKLCFVALLSMLAPLLGSAPFTNTAPLTGKVDLQFQLSPPYSTSGEIARRFSNPLVSSAYTLAKEKFQAIVPETYTNDLTFGLLVWISPGHEPGIPKDWPAILAKHKLLFVSPYNAGNDRNSANRPAGTI